jgi:hypothetical protein
MPVDEKTPVGWLSSVVHSFFGDMLNMLEQTLATPPDLSPHGLMKTGWQG